MIAGEETFVATEKVDDTPLYQQGFIQRTVPIFLVEIALSVLL